MKPMLKYRGGKSRELAEITPFVPSSFDRYVEPFFGGGALFFALEPQRAIVNDLNSKLMGFYRGVRDDFEHVHVELGELAHMYNENRRRYEKEKEAHPKQRVCDPNEGLYYELRDMFNGKVSKKYSDASLYYFINKTSYSGMIRYNSEGQFNVPYGRYKRLNEGYVSEEHSKLLSKAQLMSGDYQAVFDVCREEDFVFLDPPYDCVFSDYGNEEAKDGFGVAEHCRLARAFYSLPCKALLVIGATDLTRGLYGASIVHEYEKNYAVNIRNRFKATGTHMLVANYRET